MNLCGDHFLLKLSICLFTYTYTESPIKSHTSIKLSYWYGSLMVVSIFSGIYYTTCVSLHTRSFSVELLTQRTHTSTHASTSLVHWMRIEFQKHPIDLMFTLFDEHLHKNQRKSVNSDYWKCIIPIDDTDELKWHLYWIVLFLDSIQVLI